MKDFDVNRVCDAIRGGKMSRREIHQVLGAVGFGLAVVPLPQPASAEEIAAVPCGDGHPMTFTWSGYDEVNFHKQYINEHGCASNFTFWGDEEEAFAKMRAGFEPDIMAPCTQRWIWEWDFVSIPWMAGSGFLAILVLLGAWTAPE